MVDVLTSPLDLLLDALGFALWAPMAYAFWLMRKAQRMWRERWRKASAMLHASDEENESLRQQRSEYLYLAEGLTREIALAEKRWEWAAEQKEVIEQKEQEEHERVVAALDRARKATALAREQQREEERERIEKHRAQAMFGRLTPGSAAAARARYARKGIWR